MRICWISSSPLVCNGFGTQTHIVCRALALAGHTVDIIGLSRPLEAATVAWELPDGTDVYVQQGVDVPGAKKLYRIMPAGVKSTIGSHMMELYLGRHRPDVVVTLHDTQNMLWMNQVTTMGIPWFHWIPWDNIQWEPEIGRALYEGQAKVVIMSDFTEKLMKENSYPYIAKIYHGVDTEFYKPTEMSKAEIRTKLGLGLEIGFDKKFLVGFIGQNDERKHIDVLIRAFAKFAEGKKDVGLFMHTNMIEVMPASWSYNIPQIIEKAGIEEIFRASNMFDFYTKLPESFMRDVYNAPDVFCSTTSGEGFGLMSLYANASGVPSIITDTCTSEQIVGDWGWRIPIASPERPREGALYEAPGGFTRGLANYNAVADALEDAYQHRDKLTAFGKRAREESLRYDSKIITKQWIDLLESNVKVTETSK